MTGKPQASGGDVGRRVLWDQGSSGPAEPPAGRSPYRAVRMSSARGPGSRARRSAAVRTPGDLWARRGWSWSLPSAPTWVSVGQVITESGGHYRERRSLRAVVNPLTFSADLLSGRHVALGRPARNCGAHRPRCLRPSEGAGKGAAAPGLGGCLGRVRARCVRVDSRLSVCGRV